jgi:hypothetical protein
MEILTMAADVIDTIDVVKEGIVELAWRFLGASPDEFGLEGHAKVATATLLLQFPLPLVDTFSQMSQICF